MIVAHGQNLPELICAASASLFVLSGCGVGYVIAANGILAHSAAAFNLKCARHLVVYDIASNAALITLVLATTSWEPASAAVGAVGALGFAFSFLHSDKLPFASAIVHCVVVMGCGLVNVSAWCACCQ